MLKCIGNENCWLNWNERRTQLILSVLSGSMIRALIDIWDISQKHKRHQLEPLWNVCRAFQYVKCCYGLISSFPDYINVLSPPFNTFAVHKCNKCITSRYLCSSRVDACLQLFLVWIFNPSTCLYFKNTMKCRWSTQNVYSPAPCAQWHFIVVTLVCLSVLNLLVRLLFVIPHCCWYT